MRTAKYLLILTGTVLLFGCAAERSNIYLTYRRPALEPFRVSDSVNRLFNYAGVARLLNAATFGAVPGDIGFVDREGVAAYLDGPNSTPNRFPIPNASRCSPAFPRSK